MTKDEILARYHKEGMNFNEAYAALSKLGYGHWQIGRLLGEG
jgi:hypothetical protein